ncbi:MAG TPA: hypothetical protein VEK57_29260 [Thermoanaerobaculia bacterium]|nr:hypothetical protein [Thermoanaerobaculia bacterium]
MPSGCEVEAATFHVPVTEALVPTVERSGLRGKVEDLKSRGLSKLHGMQHTIGDRTSVMKRTMRRSIMNAKTSMRTGMDGQMTKMQSSMHSSPMKWAGIAAGSGFAIGMMGRMMQQRNDRRHHMPQLVIIETC